MKHFSNQRYWSAFLSFNFLLAIIEASWPIYSWKRRRRCGTENSMPIFRCVYSYVLLFKSFWYVQNYPAGKFINNGSYSVLYFQIIGFLYPQPPANLHKFRFTVSAVSFGRFHHGWEEEFRKLDIPIRKTMLGELFLSVPNGFSIKIFRYGSGFFLNSDRITLCYQEGSVGSAI